MTVVEDELGIVELALVLRILGPPADVVTVIVAGVGLCELLILVSPSRLSFSTIESLPGRLRFVVARFICCD